MLRVAEGGYLSLGQTAEKGIYNLMNICGCDGGIVYHKGMLRGCLTVLIVVLERLKHQPLLL